MKEEKAVKIEALSLDLASAQSTYKIIAVLLEQLDSSSNLIAMMASMIGEDMTRSITQTEAWANYLQGKRALESIDPELKRFVETVNRLLTAESAESTEPY